LHNEELHIFYSSTNIIRQIKSRRMRWARHVRGQESVQGIGRKVRRKDTLVRLRCRWEDGIRMGLRQTGWESVEWF
jgi:hypothetical protein